MANKKLLKAAGLVSSLVLTTALINRYCFKFSNSQICRPPMASKYKYSQGSINYKVSGSGSPLLLLHDISSSSSMFEWFKVEKKLRHKNKVYSLDWLGCGFSDKPPITYTSFMFIQILNSFIKDIIKEPVDIIATGISASYALIARDSFNAPIKKIIAVNPENPVESGKAPGYLDAVKKSLLSFPVIGTSLYNLNYSWWGIDHDLKRGSSKKEFHVSRETIETMMESAHIGSENNKSLFASKSSGFTYVEINNLLSNIKDFYIIVSEDNYIYRANGEAYVRRNENIPLFMTNGSTKYPHIEYPGIFLANLISLCK